MDIVARMAGQALSEKFGQAVVIDNRPGAGGNIATAAVARAPADGYTLLAAPSPVAINASLYQNLDFDLLRDIVAVAGIATMPEVLVVNLDVPAKTLPEFIAYAKANPGKLSMASAGSGTAGHIAGELFKQMTGVDLVHVPFRGGPPAVTALLGGEVQAMIDVLPNWVGQIRAGKVRALGVTTISPSDTLPDVPSIGQFVPGFEASFWCGFGVPAATPPDVVAFLNREINTALAEPNARNRLASVGVAFEPKSPVELSAFMAEEVAKWAKVVKVSGAKPN